MTAAKRTKESVTAGENVYQYLRTSILELQVKPGQTININELSTFLNVSRSPIRDALIQLAKDGLVTTTPQKSTIVSKIDIARARDERFMRACVEERVLEEFLDCYTPEDIETLKDILTRQQQAIKEQDTRGFLRADDDFHSVFYNVTNHPFSLHNILNMSGHYLRIRLLSLSQRDVCEQSLQQHWEILQLIQAKNRSAIRNTIKAHIVEKKGEEAFMTRKYPDLFTGLKEEEFRPKIWEEDFLRTV